MDTEAFLFDPTLPHTPSLRILIGLGAVLGALQGGIHRGHPDSGWVISFIYLAHGETLMWTKVCFCPHGAGHNYSPTGWPSRTPNSAGALSMSHRLTIHQHILIRYTPLGSLFQFSSAGLFSIACPLQASSTSHLYFIYLSSQRLFPYLLSLLPKLSLSPLTKPLTANQELFEFRSLPSPNYQPQNFLNGSSLL